MLLLVVVVVLLVLLLPSHHFSMTLQCRFRWLQLSICLFMFCACQLSSLCFALRNASHICNINNNSNDDDSDRYIPFSTQLRGCRVFRQACRKGVAVVVVGGGGCRRRGCGCCCCRCRRCCCMLL